MLIDIGKKCVSSEKLDWGNHKNMILMNLVVNTESGTEVFDTI